MVVLNDMSMSMLPKRNKSVGYIFSIALRSCCGESIETHCVRSVTVQGHERGLMRLG
jgi:hypothetical protein